MEEFEIDLSMMTKYGLTNGCYTMVNDKGERVKEAGPSMPVEIAGFTDVPSAGDDMMAVEDDRLGRGGPDPPARAERDRQP